jgi:hypothetical protein
VIRGIAIFSAPWRCPPTGCMPWCLSCMPWIGFFIFILDSLNPRSGQYLWTALFTFWSPGLSGWAPRGKRFLYSSKVSFPYQDPQ